MVEQGELKRLIERCRAGEAEAQEALVVEAQNRVYYHCKKFLKNKEDALDATQDVLTAMLTHRHPLSYPAVAGHKLTGPPTTTLKYQSP